MTEELPARKLLVLDANILLRALLGVRVRGLLQAYEDSVDFFAPDVCFHDARRHVGGLARERQFDPQPALLLLDQLPRLVEPIELSLYAEHETPARLRIASRDPDDWPIVAARYCSVVPCGPKIGIS